MFHDNCHLSSTLCVTRGDIYNMSGAISANVRRNESVPRYLEDLPSLALEKDAQGGQL